MLTLLVIRAVHVIATEWRVLHYVTDRASEASEEARSSSRVAYRRPPQATKDSKVCREDPARMRALPWTIMMPCHDIATLESYAMK